MSIIEDCGLLRLCRAGALEPFDESLIQPASVDLRLGTTFRVARTHKIACIDLAAVPSEDEISEMVEVPLYKAPCPACEGSGVGQLIVLRDGTHACSCGGAGVIYDDAGQFIIHPGEFVLGSTLERIRVPIDVVMALEGKSSLARLGLLPHVQAGYFDPGWDGVGTLEMVNLSEVPIILRPGLTICQSRWTRLENPAARPYSGRYQGDLAVAGSRYSA